MDVLVVVGVGGMGEAIARRVGHGHHILLADFNQDALDLVAERLKADGFAITAAAVDVSDKASIESLAAQASSLGRVSKVAHTAGLSPVQAPVAAILHVDLAGVAYSLDAFAGVIAEGGAGIVVASMAGTMAAGQFPPEMEQALAATPSAELLDLPFLTGEAVPNAGAAYGIAKRANQVRVQSASLAWGSRGARINSISPGVISTAMGAAELQGESGAFMRAMIDGSGTKRVGTASDIAAAAAFLLGPDSSFITGTDLLVDGGVVAAVRSGAIVLPTA